MLGRGMGGNDCEFIELDENPIEEVGCPEQLETVEGAYAVYVVGDSMSPKYDPGCLLYIHPNRPHPKGTYVLVHVKSDMGGPPCGYIKQFVSLTPTRLILRQLNPEKEIEFERSQVVAIHRIVGCMEM